MYYVFVGMFFFFAIYGFVCCIVNLVRLLVHQDIDGKYAVLYVGGEDAEGAIRCAMAEHNDCEIIVVNKSASAEVAQILSCMEREYSRVHVI